MHNHAIPVTLSQLQWHMPCYVSVHFSKVLGIPSQYCYVYRTAVQRSATDRNEETRCTVGTREHVRKQFQPCIIPVHDQLSPGLVIKLRKPGILVCQAGRRVGFGEVEDHI